MFPPSAPRLLIRSPSPTTIEFTVTTFPVLSEKKFYRYLLLGSVIFLRILLFCLVLCVGWVKWSLSHTPGLPLKDVYHGHTSDGNMAWNFWSWIELLRRTDLLQSTKENLFPRNFLAGVARTLDWKVFIVGGAIILWGVTKRYYTEESLLVLRGLGIQTSSTPSTYFCLSAFLSLVSVLINFICSIFSPISHSCFLIYQSSASNSRFIPTTSIQDIFINEGFKGFEVKFYLAVVVKGEEEVVVVFPKILPKRKILEVVWRRMRECLYEGVKHGGAVAAQETRGMKRALVGDAGAASNGRER